MKKIVICVWLVACLLVGLAVGLSIAQPRAYTRGAVAVAECVRDGATGWYIIGDELRCIFD